MIKKRNGRLFAVVFTVVCMFVAMLGGFVGLFNAIDTSTPVIADAATTIESYYQPLADDMSKTGTAFRTELASLITSTHSYNPSYSGLRNIFDESDADPNKSGNIIWFYTGTSVPFNGSFGSSSGTTNREHVWPKNAGKAFPAESEAGSDAHHLRPTEQSLNSTRSDNSFGEVPQTNANIVDEAGKTNYPSLCYMANNTFYPGAGFRGATARILMYVQTRWGDQFNLSFVLGNGNNKTIGDIEDLFKWHLLEPPTEAEKARNEVVFGIQGNRNPFIDHPEYAEMIYCYDGEGYNDELQAVLAQYGGYLDDVADTTIDVTSVSVSPSTTNLTAGEKVTLTATVLPENAVKTVTWTSSNPNVASVDANTGAVTAVSAGTATITATSTKTPSIKGTATINVKSVSAISITGTPTKTTYEAGEKFNPTGITVKATYSDSSTATIPNSQITWLDGTTRQDTLSLDTTTVIAKYGTLEKTISGITVKASTTKTLTITRDSFQTTTSTYGWNNWSTNGISGQAFMYPGKKDSIQMNNSKTSYFLFSNTALPGDIVSVTVKSTTDTTWELRTSTSSFSQASGTTSAGTSRGTISANSNGAKLDVNTTDRYFALNYKGSGPAYVTEIIIVYKFGDTEASCQHTASDWIIDSQGDCQNAGAKHTECTKCGEVLDAVEIPATNNHSWSNWQVVDIASCSATGKETRECSVCHQVETNITAKTSHDWSDWTETTPADCGKAGEEMRECSVCNEEETRAIPQLTNHDFGQWTPDGEGKETRECSVCGKIEDRADANFDWAKDFKDAVEAVKDAEKLDAKWNAIKTALTIYNEMKPEHQSLEDCIDAYIALEEEINAYNKNVASLNAQSKRATNDAINLFAGSFAILAFLAYLLSKKA